MRRRSPVTTSFSMTRRKPLQISHELRKKVLSRDRNACQMCGATKADFDPYTRRMTRVAVCFHTRPSGRPVIQEKHLRVLCSTCSEGLRGIGFSCRIGDADDTPQNLRAVCSNCNEGLQNSAPPKPDRLLLLSQLRRATIDDQEAVLNWLLGKFGLVAKKKE